MRDRHYFFQERHLSSLAHAQPKLIAEYLDHLDDEEIESLSDESLHERVRAEFFLQKLTINESAATQDTARIKIDVSDDPFRIIHTRSGSARVDGTKLTVRIPFIGDPELWKFRPSAWRSTFPYGRIEHARGDMEGALLISIEYHDHEDPSRIKQKYDSIIDDVRYYLGNQATEIVTMNEKLLGIIDAQLASRRARIIKRRSMSSILGIPTASPARAAPQTAYATRAPERPASRRPAASASLYDAFISHAFEDMPG
jgi:hypothetical protein